MALLNCGGNIVIWSAIPYCEDVERALRMASGKEENFNVKYLIIPDTEHTMACKSFKAKFPEMKIIGMKGVQLGDGKVDYAFGDEHANKIIDLPIMAQVGLTDPTIANNFEFVYLPTHANKELVVFDKKSKTLFEADLLFNLGVPGTTSGKVTLEQYSPDTGFPAHFNPHFGCSFFTRYLQPYSKVGKYLFNKIAKSTDPACRSGLQAINSWDFERIVMCHGNIIESNAKDAFQNAFKSALS